MRLDINQFDLNNIADIAFSKTGDAYTLESTTSTPRYAFYSHPTELPIGTRLKLSAEFKFVSDYPGEMSIVFFADNQHTTGEVDAGGLNRLDDTNDDWQKIEISGVVPAGAQYAQIRIGSVFGSHSPGTDSFKFRNVRLDIDAGINTIFPELQEAQTYSRAFAADGIENAFELYTNGAGTAIRNVDTYELRATGVVGDEAMLTLDGLPSVATLAAYQPNAKFVKVRVKADRISGLPRIVVNFYPTYGSFSGETTKYAYLVSDSMEWHEAVFAVPDGTEVTTVYVGMDTNVLGSVDVDAIKISFLGGESAEGLTPFICRLTVASGVWSIDDSAGTFANVNVKGLTQTATDIRLDLNDGNTRLIAIAQMNQGSGNAYGAKGINASWIEVFAESAPTTIINPNTVPDGYEINFLGFAMT